VKTYFIQAATGPIKIGKSRDPVQRFGTFSWHEDIMLLGYIEGDHEKELHRKFASLRLRGEWFQAGADLQDFIARSVVKTSSGKADDNPPGENLGPGKFVRFGAPLLARLEALAAQEHRSVSAMVRVLVEQALVQREFGPKENVA